MGYPRLKLQEAKYEPSKHMPLGTAAKKFGYSPLYMWYAIAKAYRLTRFTNGTSKFFLTAQIKKAKIPHRDEGGHKPGEMERRLGTSRPRTAASKMVRASGNHAGNVMLVPRSGVPVIELDADQLAELVKRGAIGVRLKD